MGIEPPKLHNLDSLVELLPASWSIREVKNLAGLTYWAVEARYPSESGEATTDDAQIAVDAARAVYDAVQRDIKTSQAGRTRGETE